MSMAVLSEVLYLYLFPKSEQIKFPTHSRDGKNNYLTLFRKKGSSLDKCLIRKFL